MIFTKFEKFFGSTDIIRSLKTGFVKEPVMFSEVASCGNTREIDILT